MLDVRSGSITSTSGAGEAEWQFKTSFTADSTTLSAPNVDLVLDGLDTYCTVELVSLIEKHDSHISTIVLMGYIHF